MSVKDGLIVSLEKMGSLSPWVLTVEVGIYPMSLSIGPGGEVPVGPRLLGLLEEMDKRVESFPYVYGMRAIPDKTKRFAGIRMLGTQASFAEVSERTVMQILSTQKAYREEKVFESLFSMDEDVSDAIEEEAPQQFGLMRAAVATTSTSSTKSETGDRFFVLGVLATAAELEASVQADDRFIRPVEDGDTIYLKVTRVLAKEGRFPKTVGKLNVSVGSIVPVRYLGVDAFEVLSTTDKKKMTSADKKALEKNTQSAKRYGLGDPAHILGAADEAQSKNAALLAGPGLIAVSLQWSLSTNKPTTDGTGNRLVGVVYKTNENDSNVLETKAKKGTLKGRHINKTLLTYLYSKNGNLGAALRQKLPLVEYRNDEGKASTDGLRTTTWLRETGTALPPAMPKPKTNDPASRGEIKGDEETAGTGAFTEIIHDPILPNDLSFVKPYDDRVETGALYGEKLIGENEVPFSYKHQVRIGDVMISIPPLSIQVNKTFKVDKVKTMRSKSSLQKNVGRVTTAMTMTLYFHDLENLNGFKTKGYTDSDLGEFDYYMDGLRPLIAQFKKAPFLPIDNEYINEELNIHNVALYNIETSTVQDFPSSVQVTLTLVKFDTATYMMGESQLGELINYPLLRWHYQKLLSAPSEKEPWRSHLPIVSALSNTFTFSLVKEASLQRRKSAISELRGMRVPEEMEQDLQDKTTSSGMRYEDAKRAQKILDQYERYLEVTRSTMWKDMKEKMVVPPGSSLPGFYDPGDIAPNKGESAKAKEYGKYFFAKIYENYDGNQNNKPLSDYENKPELLGNQSSFIPKEYQGNYTYTSFFYGSGISKWNDQYSFPGAFMVAFFDQENINLLGEAIWEGERRGDGSQWFAIPATDGNGNANHAFLTILKQIAADKSVVKEEIKSYAAKYDALLSIVNQTEEDLEMEEYELSKFTPISLTVSLENQLAALSNQASDAPALQFMGAQDPSIQVVFEADHYTVGQLEYMLQKVADYVREFREGIVSSFMQINNPLVNMYGIQSVLPENISYSTVQNYPDRQIVTMTFQGFDKTQRRQEMLYSFNGANPSDDMKARYYENYDKKSDNMIIERRIMQMELYPDLEMPTVKELERVLPQLATKIKAWKNPGEQKYLDPDFYVSTSKTLRNVVNQMVNGKDPYMSIQWRDQMGLELTSNAYGKGPIELDEENKKLFQSLEESVEWVDPRFKWDVEDESSGESTGETVETDQIVPPETFKNDDVRKYMTPDENGVAPYMTIPTYGDFLKIPGNEGMNPAEFEKWRSEGGQNPTEEQIWFYAAQQVINQFGDRVWLGPQDTNIIFYKKNNEKLDTTKTVTNVNGGSSAVNNNISGITVEEVQKSIKEISKGLAEYEYRTDGEKGYYMACDAKTAYYAMYKMFEDHVKDWDLIDIPDEEKPESQGHTKKNPISALVAGGKSKFSKTNAPRYPMMRVFGYVRAMMKYYSNWEQFDGKNKPVASLPNPEQENALTRVGLMGVSVASMENVQSAMEVSWSWRRNIEVGVQRLAKEMKRLEGSRDLRLRARPLDWAVCAYSGVEQPNAVLKDEKDATPSETYMEDGAVVPETNGLFNKVHELFKQSYALRKKDMAPGIYAGGKLGVLPEVFALYRGLKGKQLKAWSGDPEAMIRLLMDDLYYHVDDYTFEDKWYKSDVIDPKYDKEKMKQKKKDREAELRATFAKGGITQLRQVFFQHLNTLIKKVKQAQAKDKNFFQALAGAAAVIVGAILVIIGSVLSAGVLAVALFAVGGIVAGLGAAAAIEGVSDVLSDPYGNDKTSQIAESYEDMEEAQEAILKNRQLNTMKPDEIFKKMFTDMLETDMAGRLVRAFPTFLFIVADEGKWMANYKMWDNFYGYQAIESIDIHKSRKIAADTAVVRMSNMYGNLTAKRSDMVPRDLNLPSFTSGQFWSEYVFGKPSEEYLKNRKDLYKSMSLETGARVHIRLGYGANPKQVPVVFNGTITEISSADVVEMVCQGDGVELTNTISGDPDDKNKQFFVVQEPSELLSSLLTSKGNWMADMVNNVSDGLFYKDNPLGIAHFGAPFVAPTATLVPLDNDYGEAAQNIYSQNGTGSQSQWLNADGSEIGFVENLLNWDQLLSLNPMNFKNPADEDNILLSLYNNTYWDILQTVANCSSDYIGAVAPFEMRSTVFFGKPHWPYTYKYDSRYEYDEATKVWSRTYIADHKKPFMQMHLYNSFMNIVSNDIKASEDGVYTNVIVNYDGHVCPIVQADNDIRIDKQKTLSVEANIVARFTGLDYWTSEAQAQKYGHSAVRDFMKDMYKGQLTVLGDASVKPYDAMYLSDSVIDMNGVSLVKSVTHHMSGDEGFYTTIEPDAYVVNWDYTMLSLADKLWGVGKHATVQIGIAVSTGVVGTLLARKSSSLIKKGLRKFDNLGKDLSGDKTSSEWASKKVEKFYTDTIDRLDIDPEVKKSLRDYHSAPRSQKAELLKDVEAKINKAREELKELKKVKKAKRDVQAIEAASDALSSAKNIARIAKSARMGYKTFNAAKTTISIALSPTIIVPLMTIGISLATESLFEAFRRKKQDTECVKIFPLQYKGREFTAGINGHRGAVWGDDKSLADRIFDAQWGVENPGVDGTLLGFLAKTANFLSDTGDTSKDGDNFMFKPKNNQ